MKPCFFIGTTLADNPVPHQFVALANELVRRGHQVVILAPHRVVHLENHEGNPAIFTWPSPRPTGWRDAVFLWRLIRRFRPTCFIANFVAVNVMTVVGWLTRVPQRIAWYHTVSQQLSQDSIEPGWKQMLKRWRKRLVYSAATQVVANSRASAEDVQCVYSVPESKCVLFHNAISDPLQNVRLANDKVVSGKVVCVGRFFPSKGQDVLIRALAILRKNIPPLQVEFIGEGPTRESCEQLASSLGVRGQCTFAGQVNHDLVLARMSSAVAVAVPSRNEAFGLVNIEAMSVGAPVVGSRVGGMTEIIRDGLDGFLVPVDDPEVFAEKLRILTCDARLRKQMGCQARQRFLSNFELQQAISQQANWFESLVIAQRSIQPWTELNSAPRTM